MGKQSLPHYWFWRLTKVFIALFFAPTFFIYKTGATAAAAAAAAAAVFWDVRAPLTGY